MTGIDVVPQELRIFCSRLRDLRVDIQANRIAFARETTDMASYWSDKHYTNFRTEQEEFWLLIQAFENWCDHICDYLDEKAAAGEAYLNL